ncbi:MAG: hypothetical protein QXO51_07135 [Halobacteria archaeon]
MSALRALALCILLSAPSLAHVGPGAHENLFYAAPPGPRTLAPGDYYAVEYRAEPGMEFVLGVVKTRGTIDLLWMNGSQLDAYRAAVAAGGGPISYDHTRSPLVLNQRWDDYWHISEPGRYAVVVDNTRLPAGGGPGREEAEVYIALGSSTPLPTPPPEPAAGGFPAWLLQAAAGGGVAGLLGWRAVKRRGAGKPKGRGRQ